MREGRSCHPKKLLPDPQSHHADVPRGPDLGSFHIQGIKMTDLKQHMTKRMGWLEIVLSQGKSEWSMRCPRNPPGKHRQLQSMGGWGTQGSVSLRFHTSIP